MTDQRMRPSQEPARHDTVDPSQEPARHDAADPFCLAPLAPTRAQRLRLPFGAWDTHAHVIGAAPEYPLVSQRSYTPPPAPAAQYLRMLDEVGFMFGVVVQISVHGTDNSLLLQTLKDHPDRLRGVAVIEPTIGDAALRKMHEAGITGLRITSMGGSVELRHLESLSAICVEHGWHLELSLGRGALTALLPRLRRLKATVMIDHMAHCEAPDPLSSPNFAVMRELLAQPDRWIKLCGAFRLSRLPAPYPDMHPLAAALIGLAPDRVVWGTDWPYVGLYPPANVPREGDLLDALHDACSRMAHTPFALLQAILVDNPARLYRRPMT